jgi:GxxExxY protein
VWQHLPGRATRLQQNGREPPGAARAQHTAMMILHEEVEALTERVIGCGIEVHRALGPGLVESVYRECLVIELRSRHVRVETGRRVKLEYRGQTVPGELTLDLVVEARVIVAVKAVEHIHPVHQAQVITYLKLSGHPAGLLMNFNSTTLRGGLRRLVHPDLYVRKTPGCEEATGNRL